MNIQRRYVAASITAAQSGFNLVAGHILKESLSALLPTAPMEGSARVQFFGKGSNNDTFLYRLWGVSSVAKIQASGGGLAPAGELDLEFLGGGTATLSQKTGITGGIVGTGERFADTITWTIGSAASTPKGILSAVETAFNEGASGVYSPADDTEGSLLLPSLGRFVAILVEVGTFTGTTEANVLIESGA